MPKDFGDWLGAQTPLEFNDPTPQAPAKPLPAPRVKPPVNTAAGYLIRKGFSPKIHADTLETDCLRCGARVVVAQRLADDYVRYHDMHNLDPRLCQRCNSTLPYIRKFP